MSQQNKTTLQSNINSQLADNISGDISAADVRNNLIDITDSLLFNNGPQSITGSLTVTGGIIGGSINSSGSTLYSTTGTTPTNFSTTNSIFLGDDAGTDTKGSLAEASFSNFLGYKAGFQATYSGNSNFFGLNTGYQAAYSNFSNFIGMQAGYLAVSAANANFLGQDAGGYATNAGHSNFFGNIAGNQATNAGHSNFIGRAAGYQAKSASFSTLLGYLAGYAPQPSLTIGSNNIIIGTNITLAAGRKDSINIGGIIFGTGSISTTIPFGTPISGSANGKIGINVIQPTYTLDVSGSGNYTNGLTVTGSIISTSGFTGSLQGTATTASYFSGTVVSASYAQTASYVAVNYTIYKALLTLSSGTFTVTQLQNTIGDGSNLNPNDIQWSNISNGVIRATKTGAFTSSNILISVENINGGGVPYICMGKKDTSSFLSVSIFKYDGTQLSTPNFSNLPIEIRIY